MPIPGLTTWRVVLLSALLALVLALPSLGHDFVYDDVAIVESREALWVASVGDVLTAPYWPTGERGSLWRPVTLLLFAAQWAVGDGSPAVFHGANILLYAVVSGLVALLGSLLFAPAVGMIAGLLFAAHPVHVEATANVVGQAELTSGAAYLGVLILAWKATRAPPNAGVPTWIVAGVGLLALLGMGAKEHVVTLPGALVVLWWFASHRRSEPLADLVRRQWPILVATLVPIGLYLAARTHVLGETAQVGGVAPGLDPDSVLQRVVVMLPVSLHWLRLLFWPVQLSADYGPEHLPVRTDPGGIHLVAIAIWLAVLVGAWRARTRIPAVAVGTGLFVVTISVVSSIVVPLEIRLAERFLFLPSVGWALAMGGLAWAAVAYRPRAFVPVSLAVVVVTVLFGFRSLERTPVWGDRDAFFLQMQDDAPRSFRIPWIAAEQALILGDTAQAEQLMREGIRRNPYNPTLTEELGFLLMDQDRHEVAIPLFIQALEQDLERRQALQGLTISLIRTGRGVEALRWLGWLEELHGTEPLLVVLRAEALREAGRYRESLEVARTGLQERPADWNLRLLAAESAALAGLCEEALRHLDEGEPNAPADRRSAVRLTERPAGPLGEAVVVALGLATFYLLVRTSPFLVPGSFHDDAVYLAVGRALAEGEGYRSIYAVGEPIHAKYPPGLPVVYALMWWIGTGLEQVTSAALLLSLLVTSAAAGLMWWVARARLKITVPVALFFALGPFLLEGAVQYFNLALSEPYYLALWAAALVLFHLVVSRPRPDEAKHADAGSGEVVTASDPPGIARAAGLALALGAALAGATLFRGQGIVLIPGVLLGLVLVGASGRTLLLTSAAAVVPVVAWKTWHSRALARGPVGTQPDEEVYTSFMPAGGISEAPGYALEVLNYTVRTYGTYMPSYLSGVWALGAVILLGIVVLAVVSGVRLWRGHPDLVLTCALSVAVILLWPWAQDRFALTLLPVLGLLAAAEVDRWQGESRGRRRGVLVALTVVAVVVGVQQVEIRRTAYPEAGPQAVEQERPPLMAHLPNNSRYLLAASGWVRENTEPDATLLVPHGAGIWLATGRRVINATPALPQVGPVVWDEPGRFIAERLVHDRPDLVVLGSLRLDIAVEISTVQQTCPEALEFLGSSERYARVAFYRVRYEDPCLEERILGPIRRAHENGAERFTSR